MKECLLALGVSLFFCFACSKTDTVHISGRIENGDSIVSIWVEDSIYKFQLDENDHFSGIIHLKESGYATLLHNSLNLYLASGQDLEIYGDANNLTASLYFRGSLAGINRYLKEQEVAVFFDRAYYELPEDEFIQRMKDLLEEKKQLLIAKNFEDDFTALEIERIRYTVAERVSFYPLYQIQFKNNKEYQQGENFKTFMASFSLNNERLFKSLEYRSFLLNYVNLQNSSSEVENRTDRIADYILSRISSQSIKDFLLTETVYQHIQENNGLNNAEYVIKVFRRECKDRRLREYVESMIANWEKLMPGKKAPDFVVTDEKGEAIRLDDFKGSYLYISVWATWCVPCKNELPYLNLLQENYNGRNIKFLTISIDKENNREQWLKFLDDYNYSGLHAIVDNHGLFTQQYMIISIPRFILISPEGVIINSNAPRPSGKIDELFQTLNL